MRLDVEDRGRLRGLLGHRYRITSIDADPYFDGQSVDIQNHLFDFKRDETRVYYTFARDICHLRPEIRQWLEDSLPFNAWRAEHPLERYRGVPMGKGRHCGLLMSDPRHLVLFKLAWGGAR